MPRPAAQYIAVFELIYCERTKMRIPPSQVEICERCRVKPVLPLGHDRFGIALETLRLNPINGLRVPALSGSSGWFIYGGDTPSSDPNFYSSLCVKRTRRHCECAVPYLCLPPGWRFQIDSNGYEDVWYDEALVRLPT